MTTGRINQVTTFDCSEIASPFPILSLSVLGACTPLAKVKTLATTLSPVKSKEKALVRRES
jgi:hypothetical protein